MVEHIRLGFLDGPQDFLSAVLRRAGYEKNESVLAGPIGDEGEFPGTPVFYDTPAPGVDCQNPLPCLAASLI
jgi:hypothetical protein